MAQVVERPSVQGSNHQLEAEAVSANYRPAISILTVASVR